MLETILKKIKGCIQCGICSASCPLNFAMDIPVRKLINLLKSGYLNEVLRYQTFWLCASCYFCRARCPKKIDLAEVMYSLHSLSIEEGIIPENKLILSVYRTFMKVVGRYGRNFEPFMLFLFLYKFPRRAFSFLPLGISFLRKKRVCLKPSRIKEPKRLRDLLKHAEKSKI